jgi:ComF family protein
MDFFDDLLHLFFPRVCCSCANTLVKNEELICFACRSKLPKVKYENLKANELKERFDGKLPVAYAIASLNFLKSGITQKLLHEFKYNNKTEIGELFGRQIGAMLMQHQVVEQIDVILPVPLHPQKERRRGYNQSHYFAKGISEITSTPMRFDILKRIENSKSQTSKTREMRWKSVENAFAVAANALLEEQHILLVDDVVTTGATIEACGNKLLSAGAAKISLATLAIAK